MPDINDIRSPHLLGLTDFSRITRLLDREEDRRAIFSSPNDIYWPDEFKIGRRAGEIIGILIDDTPSGGTERIVHRMFVSEWPIETQTLPGVVLERHQGRWLAAPYIYSDVSTEKSIAFLIREGWIKALHLLAKGELEPLLRYGTDRRRVAHAKIAREVQSLCNYYMGEGYSGFFSTPERYLDWNIAAFSPAWEQRAAPVADRIRDLRVFDSALRVTPSRFRAICQRLKLPIATTRPIGPENRWKTNGPPSAPSKADAPSSSATTPAQHREPQLATLIRTGSLFERLSTFQENELETIFLTGRYESDETEPATLTAKELKLVRDWSPEADALFSYGGQFDLSYDVDSKITDRFPERSEVTLQTLIEKVWWWKSAMPDFARLTAAIFNSGDEKNVVRAVQIETWPRHLIELFRDNWERSAFFYEFRARYRGYSGWDIFEKPWVKLNTTERGILACMWPIQHPGRFQCQPKLHPLVLSRMKSRIAKRVEYIQGMPPATFQHIVSDKLAEELKMLGYTMPGRGKGAPRWLPWRALEYLDLEYYWERRYPDNESKLKSVTKTYKKACQEFGIAP